MNELEDALAELGKINAEHAVAVQKLLDSAASLLETARQLYGPQTLVDPAESQTDGLIG